jgi:hypothetical protein
VKNSHIGLALVLALTAAAQATIPIPSDGSDGAFNPTADVQVDLSQAVTAAWDANNAAHAGKGVYDPAKWAVVFKYSSVNIPAGVTVTFKNHSPNAPVAWLVQGGVSIAGGRGGTSGNPGSAGFGPGGGLGVVDPSGNSATGNYGDPSVGPPDAGRAYGNAQILPLIGGSGGGGFAAYDNGAGGGAILIAAGAVITLDGSIQTDGGYERIYNISGSGGAIRLLSDHVAGNGRLSAQGRHPGRIRIETNDQTYSGASDPPASAGLPNTPTPDIWPPAAEPALKMISIGGVAVPSDPTGAFTVGSQDVTLPGAAPAVVRLQATNVPSTWTVYVRVVPFSGDEVIANATKVSGNDASSVWEATIAPNLRFSAVQARAVNPNP